jgi:hypothetical protein
MLNKEKKLTAATDDREKYQDLRSGYESFS